MFEHMAGYGGHGESGIDLGIVKVIVPYELITALSLIGGFIDVIAVAYGATYRRELSSGENLGDRLCDRGFFCHAQHAGWSHRKRRGLRVVAQVAAAQKYAPREGAEGEQQSGGRGRMMAETDSETRAAAASPATRRTWPRDHVSR